MGNAGFISSTVVHTSGAWRKLLLNHRLALAAARLALGVSIKTSELRLGNKGSLVPTELFSGCLRGIRNCLIVFMCVSVCAHMSHCVCVCRCSKIICLPAHVFLCLLVGACGLAVHVTPRTAVAKMPSLRWKQKLWSVYQHPPLREFRMSQLYDTICQTTSIANR